MSETAEGGESGIEEDRFGPLAPHRQFDGGIAWHYTSISNALSIIRSGQFWAFDVRYMNDAKEYIQALEDLDARCEELWNQRGLGIPRSNATTVDALLDQRFGQYAISFSAAANDLSQWRAYGGDLGCALVFDLKRLRDRLSRFLPDVGGTLRYGKCVYDPKERASLVEIRAQELADIEAGDRGASQFPPTRPALSPVFRAGSAEFWHRLAAESLFKNEAFASEREHRLWVSNPRPENVAFITGRSMLRPYVPLRMADKRDPDLSLTGVLVKVVLGPTRYPLHTAKAFERFLTNQGLGCIAVEGCGIPFRSDV